MKSDTSAAIERSGSGSGSSGITVKPNADKKLFIDAARLLMTLWDSTSKGQTHWRRFLMKQFLVV